MSARKMSWQNYHLWALTSLVMHRVLSFLVRGVIFQTLYYCIRQGPGHHQRQMMMTIERRTLWLLSFKNGSSPFLSSAQEKDSMLSIGLPKNRLDYYCKRVETIERVGKRYSILVDFYSFPQDEKASIRFPFRGTRLSSIVEIRD